MLLKLDFQKGLTAALSQKWPNCLNDTAKQPRQIECEGSEKVGILLELIEDLIAQYIHEYDPSVSEDDVCDVLDIWGCVNQAKEQGGLVGQMEQVDKVFSDGDSLLVCGTVNAQAAKKIYVPLESDKCPVTILTGFLGAGKTTLLNHILHEQTDQKFLVIENEFGSESIDNDLIKKNKNVVQKAGMAEAIISLDNGCACCTIRSDLRAALVNTAQWLQKQKANGAKLDGILLETTGLADPRPIIRTFKSDKAIPEYVLDTFRLDAVVTVVDAENIKKRLDLDIDSMNSESEAFQQIAMGDTILLNKTDLVSWEHALSIKDLIRSINPIARIMPTVKSKMDLSSLGKSRAYDLLKIAEIGGDEFEVKDDDDFGVGHGSGDEHGQSHGHQNNDDNDDDGQGRGLVARAQSFALKTSGVTSEIRYKSFLNAIIKFAAQGSNGLLLRSKGVLAIQGRDEKVAYHTVMDTHDEEVIGNWEQGQERYCKAVFIGLGLNKKLFEAAFDKMVLGGSRKERKPRQLPELEAAGAPLSLEPVDILPKSPVSDSERAVGQNPNAFL